MKVNELRSNCCGLRKNRFIKAQFRATDYPETTDGHGRIHLVWNAGNEQEGGTWKRQHVLKECGLLLHAAIGTLRSMPVRIQNLPLKERQTETQRSTGKQALQLLTSELAYREGWCAFTNTLFVSSSTSSFTPIKSASKSNESLTVIVPSRIDQIRVG